MLSLHEITKSFDDVPVLRSVSLTVGQGEIVALLGASGSGKTTLLRIIAGLEEPDEGELRLNGRSLAEIPIHRRNFGLVFQDFALFPHKSVADNVAFGLRMRGWSPERMAARTAEVLELVGLAGFAGRAVYDLSGGEQQRVALARSLAPAPQLLLLDEPLGALDRALRERLMTDLRAILKRVGPAEAGGEGMGMTAVYVTHDQAEALAIADRVAILHDGRIEQEDEPLAIYRRPASVYVARFLGMDNLVPGTMVAAEPPTVQTALGPLQVDALAPQAAGASVTLLIRPEAARVTAVGAGVSDNNVIAGRLTAVSFRGRFQQAQFLVAAVAGAPIPLEFEFDSTVALPPIGETLLLELAPEAVIPLDAR